MASPSIVARMVASLVTNLVNPERHLLLVYRDEKRVEIDFMGAVRIHIRIYVRQNGENFSITIQPIRGKCSPNHIWAAEQEVDRAVLAATKVVFRLAYTGTTHR